MPPQVVDKPEDACLIIPSFDTSCSCSTCFQGAAVGFDRWRESTAAALHAMPNWDGGRNHLLLNMDLDSPDPDIEQQAGILIRSSWTRRMYRTGYDVQLPLVKAGLYVSEQLQSQIDGLHRGPTVAASDVPPGQEQHSPATRSCPVRENVHGSVCESASHVQRRLTSARPLLCESPPCAVVPNVGPNKHMSAFLDDIIARRSLGGHPNTTLLLFFLGADGQAVGSVCGCNPIT
ncbi:MAG: hypothetical protein WDW36_006505 [Sanguina aurantia]